MHEAIAEMNPILLLGPLLWMGGAVLVMAGIGALLVHFMKKTEDNRSLGRDDDSGMHLQ